MTIGKPIGTDGADPALRNLTGVDTEAAGNTPFRIGGGAGVERPLEVEYAGRVLRIGADDIVRDTAAALPVFRVSAGAISDATGSAPDLILAGGEGGATAGSVVIYATPPAGPSGESGDIIITTARPDVAEPAGTIFIGADLTSTLGISSGAEVISLNAPVVTTTGRVQAPNGSSALPAYTFGSSPTAGMWLDAGNALDFRNTEGTAIELRSTRFQPRTDGAAQLGGPSSRWTDVLAMAATIDGPISGDLPAKRNVNTTTTTIDIADRNRVVNCTYTAVAGADIDITIDDPLPEGFTFSIRDVTDNGHLSIVNPDGAWYIHWKEGTAIQDACFMNGPRGFASFVVIEVPTYTGPTLDTPGIIQVAGDVFPAYTG